MTFIEAVKTCYVKKYATFKGRAARSEYWYFTLFYYLVFSSICLPSYLLDAYGYYQEAVQVFLGILCMLFFLGSILPSMSVQVRRLHDLDLSGWFILLNIIPVIGDIILLVLNCLSGTAGPNRFGKDSLAGDAVYNSSAKGGDSNTGVMENNPTMEKNESAQFVNDYEALVKERTETQDSLISGLSSSTDKKQ